MNMAEWILVVILCVTLFIFLVVGIILMVKIIGVTGEVKKVIIRGQDIADGANDVVTNVKGMTSIGGTVEMLVNKYINPKLKESMKGKKENDKGKNEEK